MTRSEFITSIRDTSDFWKRHDAVMWLVKFWVSTLDLKETRRILSAWVTQPQESTKGWGKLPDDDLIELAESIVVGSGQAGWLDCPDLNLWQADESCESGEWTHDIHQAYSRIETARSMEPDIQSWVRLPRDRYTEIQEILCL